MNHAEDEDSSPVNGLSRHIVAMIRRPAPNGCHVVSGSTPVVAFGDPRRAEVATLSINPSWAEFEDAQGQLLVAEQRRLADAISLGIQDFASCTDEQVRHIAEDCFTYFERNPYWRWFGPLEKVLGHAALGSYKAGTACHLDLVQWATKPIWSGLPTDVREHLLADGVPHLRDQLRNDNIRVVLLNGRTVLDQVEAVGLVRVEKVGTISYSATKDTALFRGEAEGVVFLGWSVNIQSSWGGAANDFLEALGGWIASALDSPPATASQGERGAIAKGAHADSLNELTALLEGWLETGERTIGDVANFGGKVWVRAKLSGQEVVLNSDMKRAAVEEFVQHARAGTQVLRVIANQKGVVNKVVFRPDGTATPGWYCYTPTGLDVPQEL